jgi:hypothetical protein
LPWAGPNRQLNFRFKEKSRTAHVSERGFFFSEFAVFESDSAFPTPAVFAGMVVWNHHLESFQTSLRRF